MKIKVLTIREPWASLVGAGLKHTETRSWKTKYRGWLYIHAGLETASLDRTQEHIIQEALHGVYHHGEIFLRCRLSGCIPITMEYAAAAREADPLDFSFGDFTPGRYAWILTDVEHIPPAKARGMPGIWDYDI